MGIQRQLGRYNWLVIDLDSAAFRRSLEETVAWCTAQQLVAHVDESPAIRARRALFEESQRLSRTAHEKLKGDWVRIAISQEWLQSEALSRQADPLSLSTLDAQLRSDRLRPNFAMDEFSDYQLWADAVSEVVTKRSQLLGEVSQVKEASAQRLGRLLLFVPSETLMDGGAKYTSNGFFDVNNVPPWDTWVSFSARTLVSWVPPVLVETARRGIDVNPEACIVWCE